MNPVKSKATVAAVTYMWVCGWGLWQWDVWVGCIWTLRCGRLHTHTAVFLCLFFSLVYSAVPGSQCLWAWAGVNGWGLGELASSSSTIISLRRILLCDDINLFNYPASGGVFFFLYLQWWKKRGVQIQVSYLQMPAFIFKSLFQEPMDTRCPRFMRGEAKNSEIFSQTIQAGQEIIQGK